MDEEGRESTRLERQRSKRVRWRLQQQQLLLLLRLLPPPPVVPLRHKGQVALQYKHRQHQVRR